VRRGVELADTRAPGFFEDGGGLVLAAGTVQVTELRAAQRQAGTQRTAPKIHINYLSSDYKE
jgi:hypothetical protein